MNAPTFWDHAEALRGVLLRIVGLTVALAVVYTLAMPRLFDSVILAPCRPDFPLYRAMGITPAEIHLVNIRLSSQFYIHMSTALYMALATALPAALFLLWGFIAPGLYEHERRGVAPAFGGACVMFFVGVVIGYMIVFPLTLRFLADYQLSAEVPNTISLDSYMDSFLLTVTAMGVLFELPVVAWLLGKLGILHRPLFVRYRRHAIVGLLVLAAVITPSGDPITLLAVFIPVYMLWELSALLVPASTTKTIASK